jgi:hypothetical protein
MTATIPLVFRFHWYPKNVPDNVPAATQNPAQTTPRQPSLTSETP